MNSEQRDRTTRIDPSVVIDALFVLHALNVPSGKLLELCCGERKIQWRVDAAWLDTVFVGLRNRQQPLELES